VAIIAFISIFLCPNAVSMKPASEYSYNECELVAKDFQKEFGGSLVFIQPLKADGSYDLCDYCGHWTNKKYISGNNKVFFFGWGYQKIFNSVEEMETWYENIYFGRKVEIFELDKEHPPFSIIYLYQEKFK